MSDDLVTPAHLAAVVLIAGLQSKGFIGGGSFRASPDPCLERLKNCSDDEIGDRHLWVLYAVEFMGFKGRANEIDHCGISDDDQLELTALLYDEADSLEHDLGCV